MDARFDYDLTDKDAAGLQPLEQWWVLQQIGLPDKRYQVIEHRARKYRNPVTGKIHVAPLPEAIRKGGLLGADITALVAKGWRRSMARLKVGFLKHVRRHPDHPLAKKLARRFKGDAAADYFRFMNEPEVEPAHNRTERRFRPVMIDRRITQGTRGQIGMRWCERIWTTIATCKKQN